MAAFVPLIPPTPLPDQGDRIEHATLDAKAKADLSKTFHLAKDVAAFANHLGGNLLIGVPETNGVLQAPVPLTEPEVKATQDAFSNAVAERCAPAPLIDFGEYPVADGFIVTVVVLPYVGQAIGVRVAADKTKGGYAGDAYAFPVRVGKDSHYHKPEQLSMLMLPDYRRVVVALGAIKKNDRVHVHGLAMTGHLSTGAAIFLDANVLNNTLTLDLLVGGALGGVIAIPIDYVRTVWQAHDGWHIGVRGSFTHNPVGFLPNMT